MGSQYQPWANPDPQSTAGLNSEMVYGQNVQFTTGINHRVAVGSDFQICIDPGTLDQMLGAPQSPALSGLCGSGGLGGHLQFTIGSDTRINWGRQYVINMSGETVHYEADQQTAASKTLCGMIGTLGVAYSVAYGLCPDENGRAELAIDFQNAMDHLLASFMSLQAALKAGSESVRAMVEASHGIPATPHSTEWEMAGTTAAAAAAQAIGSDISGPVNAASEEGHFAVLTSDTQSAR